MKKIALLMVMLWCFGNLAHAAPTAEKLNQFLDAYLTSSNDPVANKYAGAMGKLAILGLLDKELKKQSLGLGWNYTNPAWQQARATLLEKTTPVFDAMLNSKVMRENYQKAAIQLLNNSDCDEWLALHDTQLGTKFLKLRKLTLREKLITTYLTTMATGQNSLPTLIPTEETKTDLAQLEVSARTIGTPNDEEVEKLTIVAKQFNAHKFSVLNTSASAILLSESKATKNQGLIYELVEQAVSNFKATTPP